MNTRVLSTLALAAVVCIPAPLFAAEPVRRVIPLDEIMTKREQKSTGLHKLTLEERAALEEWLTFFANTIARESASVACRAVGIASIAPNRSTLSADAAIKIASSAAGGNYPGVGQRRAVKEKVDSGAFVLLDDGSMWQIAPIDKASTTLWLPQDTILVLKNDNFLYPYKLVSGRDTAEARFLAK
jgi:hypothetical protein